MGCNNTSVNGKRGVEVLQVRDTNSICKECSENAIGRRILIKDALTVEVGYGGTAAPSLSGSDGEYILEEPYKCLLRGFNLEANNTVTDENGDFFLTIHSVNDINHWFSLDLYNMNNDEKVDLSTVSMVQIKQEKVSTGNVKITIAGASGFGSDGFRLLARSL